jgi:hypothetical protein
MTSKTVAIAFSVLLAVVVAAGVTGVVVANRQADALITSVERLSKENAGLHTEAMRIYRAKHMKSADVPYDILDRVSHDYGVDAFVLAGIRLTENGPVGYELGCKSKDEMAVKNYERSYWNYASGARFADQIAWDYITKKMSAEGRREFFHYMGVRWATPREGEPRRTQNWGDSVNSFQAKERKKFEKKKK